MLTAPRADDGTGTVADLADEAFSSFDFSGGAVVALSGGGDSTALLFLLKDHLDRKALRAPLLAVTVDHALRAGSASEARDVARLCAAHGIAHRTMAWTGPKPATGVAAAAREARYRLLSVAAKEAGVDRIVTAHTADDQAETVLMRQARTEIRAARQDRGLAGMAPATLYDWRTWIVRPLLGVRRADLRAFLRGRGVNWIEDPTNVNEAFERPRIRAALRGQAPGRLAAVLAVASRAAAKREAVSRRAARLVTAFASRPAAGLIRLDPAFADTDREAAVISLRALLATVGGTAFLPDEARTAALFDRIGSARFCATLSRTVVDGRRAGIFLHRERRGLPAAAKAADGMVWDGRRRIGLRHGACPLVIGPAGIGGEQGPPVPGNPAPASLVMAASAAEPAFFRQAGDAISLSSDLSHVEAVPLVSPFARFLPSFDLELAAAIAGLIGAPLLPAAPFCTGKTASNA